MPSQSRSIRPGELFYWENNQSYTRVSGDIENDATTAGTEPDIPIDTALIGQPLRLITGQFQFASAAEVTSGDVDAFVVDGPPLEAPLAAAGITPNEYAIIERGPALMNEGRIPATDVYGDAIVASDYIAAALVLEIVSKALPPVTGIQTS